MLNINYYLTIFLFVYVESKIFCVRSSNYELLTTHLNVNVTPSSWKIWPKLANFCILWISHKRTTFSQFSLYTNLLMLLQAATRSVLHQSPSLMKTAWSASPGNNVAATMAKDTITTLVKRPSQRTAMIGTFTSWSSHVGMMQVGEGLAKTWMSGSSAAIFQRQQGKQNDKQNFTVARRTLQCSSWSDRNNNDKESCHNQNRGSQYSIKLLWD